MISIFQIENDNLYQSMQFFFTKHSPNFLVATLKVESSYIIYN